MDQKQPETEPEPEIFIDLDDLEDDEGSLIQGEEEEEEEYIFQCTQEDHWAQKPYMPYGNNAY